MYRKNIIFFVLLFTAAEVSSRQSDVIFIGDGSGGSSPLEFEVDLDESAGTRWRKVADHYKSHIPLIAQILKQVMPSWALRLVEKLGPRLDSYFSPEFAAELAGISNQTGIPLGDLVMINLMYELNTADFIACTTVVSQNRAGTVFLARNLDYNFAPIMRNLTFIAHLHRSGSRVVSFLTQPGYLGALTGVKWGHYAIDLNQRSSSLTGNLFEMLRRRNLNSAGMWMRTVLEDPIADFDSASEALASIPLIANSYLSIAGTRPGQGRLITRDRTSTVDTWPLDTEKGRWYVLETNYDHWKKAGDARRAKAEEGLKKIGFSHTAKDLFNVLSLSPVLNPATVYTTVISAADPSVMRDNTQLRHS